MRGFLRLNVDVDAFEHLLRIWWMTIGMRYESCETLVQALCEYN